MLPRSVTRGIVIGAVLFLIVGLLSAPVIASVTIGTDTTYDGVDADDQTIAAEIDIAPDDDAKIEDVEIEVDASENAVLDFRTFSESFEPARGDANVEYNGGGQYMVSEINTDENFVIAFDMYPKTIREEELTVATVEIEYTQRGQRLSETKEITVDLSNSEYFALQDSQQEVNDLEEGLRNRQLLTYASVAVLVLVPLVAVYRWRETRSGFDNGKNGGGGQFDDSDSGGGRFND